MGGSKSGDLRNVSITKGTNEYYQSKVQLETFLRTKRVQTLYGGGKNLSILNQDYASIEILPDSVIYCDIPYKSTNVYDEDNPFDYERFYAWCEKQTQPLFISEYWMPEDRFECVAEFQHTSTMDANSVKSVVEKVFIPKTQKNLTPKQLTLDFD